MEYAELIEDLQDVLVVKKRLAMEFTDAMVALDAKRDDLREAERDVEAAQRKLLNKIAEGLPDKFNEGTEDA